MIKFLPLGGAEEIGASCFYLNIDGTGVILDCGVDPQKKGRDSLPEFSPLNELNVDYVIISHAHQDHIGALPFFIKMFPHVKIIATPQTVEVARLTLHNAVNILDADIQVDDKPVLYTHDEVDYLLRSVIEIQYDEMFELKGLRHTSASSIRLTLYDAGHIIGSASILLEFESERIFYTGDIKFTPQTLLAGASLPSGRVTTLITESTYGATNSEIIGNLDEEIKRFVVESNKIISDGGSILIPVFALGKMQEIVSIISREMSSGRLTEVPLYTGGIGNRISHIYDTNRFKINYNDSEFELGRVDTVNYFEVNDFSKFSKDPSIIIASSGMMLNGTSSFRFARFWLTQKNFGIFAVGYMDPDSPGYKIINSSQNESVELNEDDIIQVKCRLNRFFFPTHSTREELIEIVQELNPANIILVHGEENSKDWMGNKILELKPNTRVYSASTLKWINF